MTNGMKCPFCQQELERQYDYNRDALFHKCNKCYFRGDTILWQALIQAKQDLEQSEKCCSAWETQALDYKAETIALSGKLEIAKSYVKGISEMVINSGDNIYIVIGHFKKLAEQTLEQIEHKGQQ